MQLLHYLREKQMLLLVDNVEHLLVESSRRETIADLLVEILQGADQVKLLVTSRETLNQQGEWPFEVKGLAFPEVGQDDGLKEYGAVALFVQRAQRAHPGFQMNTDDKTGIARICRLVEGMPLAIELSATWVRILSPAEIATEIEHSLDFLEASMRDLPERHRSMRAVFDHSWKILSSDEKGVLGKLSVFRDGFQRPAAEQVAGASLPVLSSLVIRSLLRRTGTGRYELHELIRQYAALKLAEDPHELHAVQKQHSLYYLGLLEGKDIDLKSKYQKEALVELTGEIDNIRVAWDWSTTNQNFIPLYQVSATFAYLLGLRSWFKEGEEIFQKTANALRASNPRFEADAMHQVVLNAMLAHCGYFKFRLGRAEEAYTILAPSVDFLRKRDDLPSGNYFLWYLGVVYWELGRFSEAMECALENQILTRKSGERWHEALAIMLLGYVTHEQGAYKQASQYLNEAVAIMRQLGDPSMTAHFLSYLGRSLQALGEFSEAEKVLREGLELSREIGYHFGMGLALHALGQVAYARENYAEARALFSECASLLREIGDPHRLSLALNRQGLNSLALNQDAEAQSSFHAALRMAYEGGLMPSVLDALTGLAAVKTCQEASEGTLELIICVLEHSATTQETKNRATQLREELEAKLSHEEIEAAEQLVRSKSLDEVVHQILGSA